MSTAGTPPGTHTPGSPGGPGSNRLVLGLIAVIIVLLGMVAGGIIVLAVAGDDSGADEPTAAETAQQTSPGEPTETEGGVPIETGTAEPIGEVTPTPDDAVRYGPVRTDHPDYSLTLENIGIGGGSVVAGFVLKHNKFSCDAFFIKQKDMARAYLIADSTNKKYAVAVDANGDPLVSNTVQANDCDDGASYGFSIQFIAPPDPGTVDVVVPFAQPFTNVVID